MPRRLSPTRALAHALEPRVMLSDIVWANRNQASNNFASTWGVNSAAAMAVVDSVIEQYERVIVDFNYSSGTQYNVNISMRDQPTNPFGGQTPPTQVGIDGSGAPESANVFIGAGNDTSGDGVGDGGGYWVDPTPDDWSEFTTVTNGFVGSVPGGSPIATLMDLYSIVAHELGHAMGMTSANGSDWETFIPALTTDTGNGDNFGGGNLWEFSNGTVGLAVLTDTDLGGASGMPVHTAVGGQSFMFNAQQYTSAVDVMNNTFNGVTGRRRLISNLQMGLVGSVANYTWVWPESFGSMYTSLNTTTGELTIRGGAGGSDDFIQVLATGGGYQITVDIGNDVPGTGPTNSFISTWTDAQISSITIDAGDGEDTIEIRTLSSGEPVTINAGTGNDTIELAEGDFDTDLDSDVEVNGSSGTDRIEIHDLTDGGGSDTYTLTSTSFSKPARTATFSDIQAFDIDGSDNNDVYNLESFSGSLNVNGEEGNDTFNFAPTSGDLDSFTGPVTLQGGLGTDTLNLHDENDTVADDYLFNSDILNFTKPVNPGAFSGLGQFGFESLLLEANNSGNTITVMSLSPTNVTLDGNGGTDDLILDDSADIGNDIHTFDTGIGGGTYSQSDDVTVITFRAIEHVVLDASDASNDFIVDFVPLGSDLTIDGNAGFDEALIGGGDFANIRGPVHFGTNINGRVIYNDVNNNNFNINYTLSGSTFTTAGFDHTFDNVTDVELVTSNQGDHIFIDNTFGYTLDVTCNDGTDLVIVGDGSLLTMDAATIRGGAGLDELIFDDTSASIAMTLTVNQTGGLPFLQLFASTMLLFDNFSDVEIDAGPLGDTITSIAVPVGTSLEIECNNGADFIDVQGHPTLAATMFPRVTINSGAGNDTVEVNTDGEGGARAEFLQDQTLNRLAVGASGRLRLAPGNHLIEVLNSTSLPASGFEIDLTDGAFVRRANPNYDFYDARVIAGYAAGAWTGLGFNSSTAAASTLGDGIGLAVAGDLFNGVAGVVGGINLQPTDMILRYTLYGDGNLDRAVDITDLGTLSTNWQLNNRRWNHGDFDFSHVVDITDLGRLSTNWQVVLAKPAPKKALRVPSLVEVADLLP